LTFKHSPGLIMNAGMITTGNVRLDDIDKFTWSTDYVFSSTWHFKKPAIQIALFYKYTDEYLEFAGNYDVGGTLDAIGQEKTSDYHTLDATLSRDFLNNRLNLSFGLKNIFNVTLVNSIGDISIHGSMDNSTTMGYGRTYFISVAYIFSK
jgi:outer membrane receptor for ferrienterochelin and colicins